MRPTYEQLLKERDEAKELYAELQKKLTKALELCGLMNFAIWRYSIGKQPDYATREAIQKAKNELGIGNGIQK